MKGVLQDYVALFRLPATTKGGETMETSRLCFYFVIALVVMTIFFFLLVKEPLPDSPLNLVHLLCRH